MPGTTPTPRVKASVGSRVSPAQARLRVGSVRVAPPLGAAQTYAVTAPPKDLSKDSDRGALPSSCTQLEPEWLRSAAPRSHPGTRRGELIAAMSDDEMTMTERPEPKRIEPKWLRNVGQSGIQNQRTPKRDEPLRMYDHIGIDVRAI